MSQTRQCPGPVATPTEPEELAEAIAERRADPAFAARLATRVAADRPILDRLAVSPVPAEQPTVDCAGDECTKRTADPAGNGWRFWPDNDAGCGDGWTCPDCTGQFEVPAAQPVDHTSLSGMAGSDAIAEADDGQVEGR